MWSRSLDISSAHHAS